MKRLLLAAGLLVSAWTVHSGQLPARPTPAEMALLPPYCADRIEKGISANNPAIARLGKGNWLHIHHYCFALNFVNRANRAKSEMDKNFYLNGAKSNFNYVVKGFEPQFWMRPQLYVELGQVHLRLKEVGPAARLFTDAFIFNPRYEPAYLALISLHRTASDGKEGLAVASEGLRHLPDSASLKKAYRELGGKEPFPEAVTKSAPNPEAAPAGAKEGPIATAERPATEGEATADNGVAAPAAAADGQVQKAAAPSIPEGCRFCPPRETQDRWRGSFEPQK